MGPGHSRRKLGAVVRVDPHTGERTPIVRLGAGRGGGPPLEDPTGLAVEASGSLVVTDSGLDAVVRVEPHTGDRTDCIRLPGLDAEGTAWRAYRRGPWI